jgi:transcriptional regulator with XRE-family HTH domain
MGLKQVELAERMGVGEQTVSLWERASRKAIPVVVDRLLRLMAEAWLDDGQPLGRAMTHLEGKTDSGSVSRQSFRRGRRDWCVAA